MNPTLIIAMTLFQVPFAEPSGVSLVDPATLTTSELFGEETPLPFSDDEGYVYARRNLKGYALTNDGRCLPEGHPDLATDRSPGNTTCDNVLACWHPSDPSGTRRHLYTQVDTTALSSAPHGGLVVWDAGLVAFADAGGGLFARVFRCTEDGRPEGEPLQVNAGTQLSKPPFYYAPFVLGRRVCGFWNPAFFAGGPERVELACLSGPDDYTVHFPSNTPIFSGETVFSLAELDGRAAIPPLRPNADGSPVKVFDQNLTPQDAAETWLATPDFVMLPRRYFGAPEAASVRAPDLCP